MEKVLIMTQLNLDKQKKILVKSKLIFGWIFPFVGISLLGIISLFQVDSFFNSDISDVIGFTLQLLLLVIVIMIFSYFFLFILHDFRYNLTPSRLEENGIFLFNKMIKWEAVDKVQHEFGFPSHLAIYFTVANKRYKAVILNSNQLEDEIEISAKLHNSNFKKNASITFRTMNTRYYPSGFEVNKDNNKD